MALAEIGYSGLIRKGSKEGEEIMLKVTKSTDLLPATIKRIEQILTGVAAVYNGDYDGWEAKVVTE